MNYRFVCVFLSALLFLACADQAPPAETVTDESLGAEASEQPEPAVTEPCAGLDQEAATECVEAMFWPAFQDDFEQRIPVFDVMERLIIEHNEELPRVQFLRALLGVAIQTEELAMDPAEIELTRYIANMRGDLHTASEAHPDNDFYRSWRLSADLITAMFLSDDAAMYELFDESVSHANANPENVMAIASTWMIFPQSTGLPEEGLAIMDEWVLGGNPYDIKNTPTTPYAKPGTFLMLGDLYARMGRAEMAKMQYEQSLVVTGANTWPYRYLAEDAIADLDATIATFTGLPDDELAAGYMISFGPDSCKMCHANSTPVID